MSPTRPAPEWTQRMAKQRRRDAKRLLTSLSSLKLVDVAVPTDIELATWRKTIDFAKRHGMVPVGFRLEKQMLGDRELRIKLVAGIHANTKTSRMLSSPITQRTSSMHPTVVAIRDADDQLQMPISIRRRTLTLLHRLATELESRGLPTSAPSQSNGRWHSDNYYGRAVERRAGKIQVAVSGINCSVTVSQNSPFSADAERADQLLMEIWPWPRNGPHQWVDGKRLRLDQRLPEVIAALETAAREEARENEARAMQEQLRQAQWEAAMARAKHLAIEERYLKVLRRNVEAWKFAHDLHAYTDDVRRRLSQQPARHDAGNVQAWLDWATGFLERCDAMGSFPDFPELEGEPMLTELKEHLGGLSPYRPSGR